MKLSINLKKKIYFICNYFPWRTYVPLWSCGSYGSAFRLRYQQELCVQISEKKKKKKNKEKPTHLLSTITTAISSVNRQTIAAVAIAATALTC